jgi:hypothetical protein
MLVRRLLLIAMSLPRHRAMVGGCSCRFRHLWHRQRRKDHRQDQVDGEEAAKYHASAYARELFAWQRVQPVLEPSLTKRLPHFSASCGFAPADRNAL